MEFDNSFIPQNAVNIFSPIISISSKSIIGFESLYSTTLFNLDNIMYNFSTLNNKLLFIDLDLSCIDSGPKGLSEALKTLSHISETAKKYSILKENIVIEIVDSKIKNTDALSETIDIYRRHGFIIALDDFGTGYSNLDRIAILRPNIVKLDISLIKDIQNCIHKQEIFKAITGLSRKIGAVVIAKGIVNSAESLKSLELRADFLQGPFFYQTPDNKLNEKLEILYKDLKCQILLNLEIRQNRITFLQNKMLYLKSIIATTSNIEEALFKIVNTHSFIESAYLLDLNGKQISSTYISPFSKYGQNTSLFSPALKDSDHSLKMYYYKVKTGESDFHITEPYVSNATGNRCSTISAVTDNNYILCIDISDDSTDSYMNLLAE